MVSVALLVVDVAALEVELVVVVLVLVVVLAVLDDVARELPQATQPSAASTRAARRAAVVAEPGKRIEDGEAILEPRRAPRLRVRRVLQMVV